MANNSTTQDSEMTEEQKQDNQDVMDKASNRTPADNEEALDETNKVRFTLHV